MVQRSFGQLLQEFRAAAGLTQPELAELAGLSQRGISDPERGARRSPQAATVRQLAAALQLDADERAALMAPASSSREKARSGVGAAARWACLATSAARAIAGHARHAYVAVPDANPKTVRLSAPYLDRAGRSPTPKFGRRPTRSWSNGSGSRGSAYLAARREAMPSVWLPGALCHSRRQPYQVGHRRQ